VFWVPPAPGLFVGGQPSHPAFTFDVGGHGGSAGDKGALSVVVHGPDLLASVSLSKVHLNDKYHYQGRSDEEATRPTAFTGLMNRPRAQSMTRICQSSRRDRSTVMVSTASYQLKKRLPYLRYVHRQQFILT